MDPGPSTSLLLRTHEPAPHAAPSFHPLRRFMGLVLCVGTVAAVMRGVYDASGLAYAAQFRQSPVSAAHEGKPALRVSALPASIGFNIANKYTPTHGTPGLAYPFIKAGRMVEPYRAATLTATTSSSGATSSRVDAESPGSCTWKLASQVDSSYDKTRSAYKEFAEFSVSATGTSVTAEFPAPGKYTVTLKCSFDALGGNQTLSTTEAVSCFYVRRELRNLMEDDRDKLLDAIRTMTSVKTHEGKQIYGEFYRGMIEFEIEHLIGAGDRDVDHLHDGKGIATQHIAISSAFEFVLQQIDSSIALPYWDYTIDGHQVDHNRKNETGRDSSIFTMEGGLFSDAWFGKTSTKKHHVTTGRFAYTEVERGYNYSVHNPYGFVRAPWNLNPSKYVTRYHSMCGTSLDATEKDDGIETARDYSWPRCATHYKQTFKSSDWSDWVWNIGYYPHGPVHVWIGGVGGGDCHKWDELESLIGSSKLTSLKLLSFTYLKNFWRAYVVNTPKYCSLDSRDECLFKCDPSFRDSFTDYTSATDLGNFTDNSTHIARTYICDKAWWPGDQLEAASPIDAPFWFIHPTLDRLLQYKELTVPFLNRTWDSADACLSTASSDCKGHHSYDMTYWASVTKQGATYVQKRLSNQEVRDMVRPDETYGMPYVYDHFRWDHCSDEGLVFPDPAEAVANRGMRNASDDDDTAPIDD